MIDSIILGDCMEELPAIPCDSIDAIVTDPPYGIDYQSSWKTDKTKRFRKIPNDIHPYIWWINDAFRVLKPGGGLLCFCRWDVQESFKLALQWAGFNVKSQIIWDRGIHGMGDLTGAFAPTHDVIWFATKGKFVFPGKRPKSIYRVQRVDSCKLLHPNEKPISLMIDLVKAITPPGGVVLDPFTGSGTTCLAAKQEGFRYIGIEKDPGYVEIANNRIASTFINKSLTF